MTLQPYAASNAFVLQFSRGLRQELRRTNVSGTCVCPGSTDTNFANRFVAWLSPKIGVEQTAGCVYE